MDLPGLPKGTETGHIMPTFTNNLVSIRKFCDAGCTVTFTAAKVTVHDIKETLILEGQREQAGAKMWRFNLTRQEASDSANHTVQATQQPTRIPMDQDDQTWEHDHVPCTTTLAIIPRNMEEPTRPAPMAPYEVLPPSIPTVEARQLSTTAKRTTY